MMTTNLREMDMVKRYTSAGVVGWIVMLTCAGSAYAETLSVGSKAPGFSECTWVKGKPVDPTAADGKHITVVEFWATWCSPCIASIPHMTELQHKYASKGVRVVGVTANEPRNTLETVKKLVKDFGDRMDYGVAFDKSGDTYTAYMDASEQDGIPTAFVVDTKGRIAWIGFPQSGLDEVLQELISGTFDLQTAKKLYKIDKRIDDAYMFGEFDDLLAATNEGLKIQPKSIDRWLAKFSIHVNFAKDPDEVKKCARAALDLAGDDPMKVAKVVDAIVSPDDAAGCNAMATEGLERALAASPKNIPLRLAYFNVLASTERTKKAAEVAAETIDLLKGKPEQLGPFAMMLAEPGTREWGGDLALRAIRMAIEADGSDPRHQLAKFHILHVCKKDRNAAIETGRHLIQLAAGDPDLLNGFAWELLTGKDTKGQYDKLALAAAEQMIRAPGGNGWTHFDTLALAKFENGKIDDAIRAAEEAVTRSDPGPNRVALMETVERYRRAKK